MRRALSPNDELYAGLKGKIEQLAIIGDAFKPGNMQDAVRNAYDAAIKINWMKDDNQNEF